MKSKTQYRCSTCGHTSPKWAGRCPQCLTWDSLTEERAGSVVESVAYELSAPVVLSDVSADGGARVSTGIGELDRVLGGGAMPGSVVLVGGEPGMGKSTLMLQFACKAVTQRVLYVTGEESLIQLKFRADRLGLPADAVHVLAETNIEAVFSAIGSLKPGCVVVDSIQTMATDLLDSSAGTVGQIRECTARLTQAAKQGGAVIFIVGHVTKDGMIAGPKVMEHIVDTVLQFEGDGLYSYRVLRALKNRYGSTNELGVFDMRASGLAEVQNPSEVLLSDHHSGTAGSAIAAVVEGTRPLLVEVQALVSGTRYNLPQRLSTGYDGRRLQMVLAILEKRGGIELRQSDVFLNVAGGISIQDPAIDLAAAAALVSSAMDIPIPERTVFFGELGLAGELRRVPHTQQRISEASRMGMTTIFCPPLTAEGADVARGVELKPNDMVSSVISRIFSVGIEMP